MRDYLTKAAMGSAWSQDYEERLMCVGYVQDI